MNLQCTMPQPYGLGQSYRLGHCKRHFLCSSTTLPWMSIFAFALNPGWLCKSCKAVTSNQPTFWTSSMTENIIFSLYLNKWDNNIESTSELVQKTYFCSIVHAMKHTTQHRLQLLGPIRSARASCESNKAKQHPCPIHLDFLFLDSLQ